ncbi:LysR family transcriptional regulator [Enterocloster citroniae]|nr:MULTISPECIES: LysR family transcriptional regulator [Clostridia]MCB7064621.1 LysR family transcriptional regulator [Enterocloster citroniae]
METRLLYYFLAIAREQSITKAAETLHVTQPTLSKQMMELEAQLGKQLLIRGKKKITLTEEGAFLRAQAQEMINLMEKTESAFKADEEIIGGDIYIGCGETPAMEFITELFKEIQTDYPGIHFHIYSGDADAVLERLDKGLLDAGLLLGPMQQEKYDYINIFKSDIYGLLMPRDCSLAEKQTVSVADLYNIPLIFSAQTYAGHQRLEWFGVDYDSLNIVATYNLIYNATFMVEQGMGYAFCLGNLVSTDGNRNLAFRPFSPDLKIDLFIVTKKYQTFSPAAKIFLSYLREKLQKPAIT